MEEIDEKLDQWIYNSIIRAEVRKVIEDYIIDEKTNAFKAGWLKSESNYDAIRINKLSYEQNKMDYCTRLQFRKGISIPSINK